MVKLLSSVICVCLWSSISQAMTSKELGEIVGQYKGITLYVGDPAGRDQCTVDIEVTQDNQVIVSMSTESGIPFYFRSSHNGYFDKTILKTVKHPSQRLEDFLDNTKETPGAEGYHYNEVLNDGFFLVELWRMHLHLLNASNPFIQLNYQKTQKWKFMDSTVAYTLDLTGCYNMVKVK